MATAASNTTWDPTLTDALCDAARLNDKDETTSQAWLSYFRRARFGFSGANIISRVTLMPMRWK